MSNGKDAKSGAPGRPVDATLGEAAAYLRCSIRTVRRHIEAGRLLSFRYVAHGPVLVTWAEIKAFRENARKEQHG